jgi:hypothetical protein
LDELLLQLVGEIVLGSEEDDSAFSDCPKVVSFRGFFFFFLFLPFKIDVLVIPRSRMSASVLGALRISSKIFTSGYSRPIEGVESSKANFLRAPESFRGRE